MVINEMMPSTILIVIALLLVSLSGAGISAVRPLTHPQTPAAEVTETYAIGEIKSLNREEKQMRISTKAGEFTVLLNEKTTYLLLLPGKSKLEEAKPATLADLNVGDRVIARGKVALAAKSIPAWSIVLMKKEDIAGEREREQDEWRRKSIAGRISSINQQKREITLLTRSPEGEVPVTVAFANTASFKRYPLDATKANDTKPSAFAELKVGDQIRVLGENSADGKRLEANQCISGSFRMLGGKIVSTNTSPRELVVKDVLTNRAITVVITDDSLLRRIRQQDVQPLLQGGTAPAGPAPVAGPRAKDLFERLPPIGFDDLKAGDMVIVSSTKGADSSRATALLLASGAEAVFNALQRRENNRRGPNTSLGLPTGFFDNPIGLP